MVKISILIIIIILLIVPTAYAIDDFAYNRLYMGSTTTTILNISTINTNHSNSTDYWKTGIGSLGTVNATQFENNAGTLSIITSWIESFGNNIWCQLTGCTMEGDITFSNAAIINPNYVQFNTSYTDGNNEGRLQWNAEDGTLEVGLPGGNVNLQIGEENLRRVKANETLVNGDVVYPCGGSANRLVVCKADYGSIYTSGVIGIATENITKNQFGFINAFGLVRDIDTTGALGFCSEGSPAWLYSDGNFTCIPPSGNKIRVVIGVIINAHATSGIIDTQIHQVARLQGLSQVDTNSLATEDVVVYNSTSGIWTNKQRQDFTGLNVTADEFAFDGIKLRNLSKNSLIDGSVMGIMMTNPPNQELPHLYIQSGGSSQFSGLVRSWGVVDEEVSFLNGTNRTDCQAYFDLINETLQIDCNTTTTGADFFVSDDFQVVGDVWIKDTEGDWHFMTRSLQVQDELHNNLLLSRSNVSLSGTNFTITDDEGDTIIVTIDSRETIMEKYQDSVTVIPGTNSTPVMNVITYQNKDSPTLTRSSTSPTVNYANVARFYLGEAGNIYGGIGGRSAVDEFIRGSYQRWFNEGPLYVSGFQPIVNATNISIGAGSMTILLDNHVHTTPLDLIGDGAFLILNNGSFIQFNSLEDITQYSDGGIISNNKYYNLVCGFAHNDLNGNRLMCIVSSEPASEYVSNIAAETDIYDSTNIFPSNTFLKNVYLPVARMVVKKQAGTDEFQILSNGQRYIDIRGTTSSAGAPASSGITIHNDLNSIQGGTTDEYYHLNSSTYTQVISNAWDWLTSIVNIFDQSLNTTDDVTFNEITASEFIGASNWTNLQNYPAACPAGSALTQLEDTIICTDSWVNVYGDTMTGNLTVSGNVSADYMFADKVGIGTRTPSSLLDVVGNITANNFFGNLNWSWLQNVPVMLDGTNGTDGIDGTNGTDGNVFVFEFLHEGSSGLTQGEIFTAIIDSLPNDEDEILVTGQINWYTDRLLTISKAKRINDVYQGGGIYKDTVEFSGINYDVSDATHTVMRLAVTNGSTQTYPEVSISWYDWT